MGIRWFRLDDFYEKDGDVYIFYPSLYARGYLFSSEYRARMDSVLGPFLNDRLKMEFVALLCLVTSALVGASTAFLVTASTKGMPSERRRLMVWTNTSEAFTTTPESATMPRIEKNTMSQPMMKCPSTAPAAPKGMTLMITSGCR